MKQFILLAIAVLLTLVSKPYSAESKESGCDSGLPVEESAREALERSVPDSYKRRLTNTEQTTLLYMVNRAKKDSKVVVATPLEAELLNAVLGRGQGNRMKVGERLTLTAVNRILMSAFKADITDYVQTQSAKYPRLDSDEIFGEALLGFSVALEKYVEGADFLKLARQEMDAQFESHFRNEIEGFEFRPNPQSADILNFKDLFAIRHQIQVERRTREKQPLNEVEVRAQEIADRYNASHKGKFTAEEVEHLLIERAYMLEARSVIRSMVGKGATYEGALEEVVSQVSGREPEIKSLPAQILEKEIAYVLAKIFDCLTANEKIAVGLHFGLHIHTDSKGQTYLAADSDGMSMAAMKIEMDVSRTRVDQIINKALRKLRNEVKLHNRRHAPLTFEDIDYSSDGDLRRGDRG